MTFLKNNNLFENLAKKVSQFNHQFSQKTWDRVVDYILFGLSASFIVVLLLNKSFFSIPNPDYFAYIFEGNELLHGNFSNSTKFGPLYSIIVTLPHFLFPSRVVTNLELAIVLNIFSTTACLYLLYQLFYKNLNKFLLLVFLLLFVNYPVWYSSLHPNNNMFFMTLVLLSFVLERKNMIVWAFFAAMVTTLVRPEGWILVFSLLVTHASTLLKNKRLNVPIILLFTPSLLWHVYNNLLKQPTDSYFSEILARSNELPNSTFIINSFYTFLLPFGADLWQKSYLFISLFFILGFITMIILKQKKWLTILLFITVYCLTHLFFPDTAARYSLSTVLILTPLLYWPLCIEKNSTIITKIRYITTPITTLLLVLSFFVMQENTFNQLKSEKDNRGYIRIAAEKLNTLTDQEKVSIATLEPWIIDYFLTNTNVTLLYFPDNCITIECIHNQIQSELSLGKKVIIIKDSYSFQNANYFFAKLYGAAMINSIPSKNQWFEYQQTNTIHRSNGEWAIFYEVRLKNAENQLSQLLP